MRIGIAVGEASGDQLAAGLITALKQLNPAVEFEGIAGPQMIQAGCKAIFPMEKIAFMGLVEVVPHIPAILSVRRQLINYFLKNPPDIFIGVDAPDFNLSLEEKLKTAGIKTVHYVSPSVWAWRRGRLKKIARAVDLMLTLLPFEAQFYLENRIPVQFVGHHLADTIPLEVDRIAARRELNLPIDATIIALLPGSRASEIKYLGELFVQTAKWCADKKSDLIFIAPMINAERYQQFQAICNQVAPELSIRLLDGQSQKAMMAADVVLLASGTATLETMLIKRPMVVAYRMAALTYAIARRLIKVSYIALPNLLANKMLVPEFIQAAATPEALGTALLNYLQHPQQVQELQKEFLNIHKQLRLNASEHAAQAVLELINKK